MGSCHSLLEYRASAVGGVVTPVHGAVMVGDSVELVGWVPLVHVSSEAMHVETCEGEIHHRVLLSPQHILIEPDQQGTLYLSILTILTQLYQQIF